MFWLCSTSYSLLLAGSEMLSLVITDMLSLVIVLSLGHVLLALGDTVS